MTLTGITIIQFGAVDMSLKLDDGVKASAFNNGRQIKPLLFLAFLD